VKDSLLPFNGEGCLVKSVQGLGYIPMDYAFFRETYTLLVLNAKGTTLKREVLPILCHKG